MEGDEGQKGDLINSRRGAERDITEEWREGIRGVFNIRKSHQKLRVRKSHQKLRVDYNRV